MTDRWVIAAAVGAWTVTAALVWGQVRRASLLVFVLSLQIGLALYVTTPLPVPSVGASWPSSLALPLAALTGVAALFTRSPGAWSWGGSLAGWAIVLGGTTLLSVAGSPERVVGMAHFLLAGAYYLVLVAGANSVRGGEDLDLVMRALMASLVLQSLLYFVQTLLGATFTPAGEWIPSEEILGRFGGTVGVRPAMFASFLLPLLLVAVAHLLTSADRRVWYYYGLPAAVGAAALILTFTRASWAGFGLGLIYLVGAAGRRRWLLGRRAGWLVVALLVLVAALAPRILARVSEDHGAAFEERWALIQMALRVIEAHPLAGVGAGAYPYVFRDYLTPELADKWLYVVHNVYVLRAAETGLLGVAAWLAFLVAAFRVASPERLPREVRPLALGWRAGLLALCWEMLWDVSLGPAAYSLLWFLCGFMIAAGRLEPRRT